MFLNNVAKKIVGLSCFMGALLCVASEQPSLSIMRKDGLIAECCQHKSLEETPQVLYAVIVQYPGQLVTKRLFARPIESMQFQDKNLEVVFTCGKKDYIPVN